MWAPVRILLLPAALLLIVASPLAAAQRGGQGTGATADAPKPTGEMVRVMAGHANIHTGPTSGNEVLVLAAKGTVLPVLARRGEWIQAGLSPELRKTGKVMRWYKNENNGWIHDSMIEIVKPAAGQTNAQSVQYKSPDGVEYRSLPDTDAVKSARAAHEADPKNIAKIIDLGVAQSGARQFREAIATFTRGLEIEPNNALLLRWRGHRYLSVREFDRAFADLTRGSTIDPAIYGNWYHLGVVQYLRGDFADAAASFAKAQPIAPDAGELAGSTDWLWMSLSRAGRGAEAKAMLDRRPEKPVTNAYTRRLQLYRGEIGPDAVVTPADTDDVQIATLAYGLGNWYLVRGDKAQARKWFERSIQASGGWPGFGFIVSEVELRRLR